MAMVLELDRTTVGVGLVGSRLEPVGPAPEFFVILDENSVVDERDACPFRELAVLVKAGPAKGDIVGLPLARGARGVAKRRKLAVNGPGLAVGVGLGLVRVEDLQLKTAHQENAAVTAILALAAGRAGRRPLNMQLNIPEFGLG